MYLFWTHPLYMRLYILQRIQYLYDGLTNC